MLLAQAYIVALLIPTENQLDFDSDNSISIIIYLVLFDLILY